MKITKILLLLTITFLLTGCPTDFEELEERYYKDDFFQAAAQLRISAEDPQLKDAADQFVKRNGTYFKRRLIENVQYLFRNPETEAVEKLRLLYEDLVALSDIYPSLIDQEFISLSERTYSQLLAQFSTRGVADIEGYLKEEKYRAAFEELEVLAEQKVLPQEWIPVKDQLAPQMPRSLYLYKTKVHDFSIEELEKDVASSQSFDYEASPSRLYVNATNIPTDFQNELKDLFKKHSSDYLSLGNEEESQYYLQVRVGYEFDEDIIESRKEMVSEFRVQYDGDSQWYNKSLSYEVFVQSRTVHISVDAQVFLRDGDKQLGRYMFESLMPQETYELGKIISDQTNIVTIDYPKEYNNYKYGQSNTKIKQLTEYAIEDAALVLTYKVLDTIDTDPDPYFIQHPPKIDK